MSQSPVATTIDSLVTSKKEALLQLSVPEIRSNFDVWAKRAIVEVSQNKELNTWILSSKENQFQFISKLGKASQAGLQIGGTRPHCYFVNMGGQLRMDITKEGLSHAIVHGQGAVLQVVPEVHRIYSNDRFSINQAEQTYVHEFSPFGGRGTLQGWFTVLHYRKEVNGKPWKEIPFVTLDKVKKIRDGYSQQNSPAWKKSEDKMLDKIATKQLLKKPFAESEGLAMLIEAEEGQNAPFDAPPVEISDRAVNRVNQAMEVMGVEPTEKVVNPEPTNGDDKQETKPKGKELF